MDHAPFILAAYAAASVVLAWCAIAPLLRVRQLKKQWSAHQRSMEAKHAPDS
ncbi:MAG: heme exporter protein CcmD [Gammaproteobacteria bacterium]